MARTTLLLALTLSGCVRLGFDAPTSSEVGDILVDAPVWDSGQLDVAPVDLRLDTPVDRGDISSPLPPGVSTFAGDGQAGLVDGPAATARFNQPHAVALDGTGALYVSDTSNNAIRVIVGGVVSTLAGDGQAGFNDGPGGSARFDHPAGISMDKTGALYVADWYNHRIRKIANGVVTTVAGNGTPGMVNGPAASAKLNQPHTVSVAPTGEIYVADAGNNMVRVIDNNMVATVAGTGASGYSDGPASNALFAYPLAVVAGAGVVYVGELTKGRIRRIQGGQVDTIAGANITGYKDGPASAAQFGDPHDLLVAPGGILYVVDQTNHAVRQISNNVVTTLAGDGTSGYQDGSLSTSLFSKPTGAVVDSAGVIYVADNRNHRIRRIVP